MAWKTLDDMDLNGKRVLVRVDINVPVADGKVTDATRIERIVPTVNDIIAKGGKPLLIAHFGRPKGKVVLDVGTGSGVLAIWAAMAGARKVYAVEATSMAQHARRLVEQNGQQEVVTVLEGYMEKLELPEKVDLIISEWMGYFLFREAMLDSVLAAKDKFL